MSTTDAITEVDALDTFDTLVAPAAPDEAVAPCTNLDGLAADLVAEATDDTGAPRGWLSIAEMADKAGVTAHTLRYYERIGLVEVPRDPAGRRRYGENEAARVVFITRLRHTAMPIRDIQAYFRLVDAGTGNEDQRLSLLLRHRDQVRRQMDELAAALAVIDYKVTLYGGADG